MRVLSHWKEKKILSYLFVCVAGLFFLIPAAISFLIDSLPDPLSLQEKPECVRTCLDRRGRVLRHFRNKKGEWRFDIPLGQVSPEALKVLLGSEDSRFFEHSGVDFPALFRAANQNLFHGRIVSGASTISMQLALPSSGGKRTLFQKIRQILYAKKLERLYSKERILEEYLNRISFGGRIYGIEAASLYYFSCHASELDLAKACVLCGLPQKPSYFRPDRHPERAMKRRDFVLLQMTRRGIISQKEAVKIRSSPGPVFRNFREPCIFEKYGIPSESDHALKSALKEAGTFPCVIRTGMDADLQSMLLQELRNAKKRIGNVHDGAGVLLDSKTGEVLALVGTLDIHDPEGGEVDASAAVRSAGSSLKPFLYAEAMDAGIIVPGTILQDAPLRYGNYSPGNYDGFFRGRVRASDALAESLNTPAIRLLSVLGEKRVLKKFHELKLLSETDPDRQSGLSLALGSAGHTLRDITNAYRAFVCGGKFSAYTFLCRKKNDQSKVVFSPGCASAVSQMLRTRPLTGIPYPAAWKTGTSSNHCDAWSFVFTPDFTIGVWFGNKNGKNSSFLNGFSSALPAASEIMRKLYEYRAFTPWPDPEKGQKKTLLCASSGLLPDIACREKEYGFVLENIPLRRCSSCGKLPPEKTKGRFLSPGEKKYAASSNGKARLKISCDMPEVHLFCDGKYLGLSSEIKEYAFPPGKHTLQAFPEKSHSVFSVDFYVEEFLDGTAKSHESSFCVSQKSEN